MPVAGAAAQPRTSPANPRARPYQPDPRYLCATRPEPRGQAASRTGPIAAFGDPPGPRLDPPERQKGGIGLRGPGETQLETDRRLIGDRVKALRARLASCASSTRPSAVRAAATRPFRYPWSAIPMPASRPCSMRLTKAGVYVADQLFATLDTTSRRLYLGEASAMWSCPTRSASCANCRTSWWPLSAPRWKRPSTPTCCCMWSTPPARFGWNRSSRSTWCLKEIGADHIPQILVWNKIDAAGLSRRERDEYDKIRRVFISAQTGAGLDLLREAIAEVAKTMHVRWASSGSAAGRCRNEHACSTRDHWHSHPYLSRTHRQNAFFLSQEKTWPEAFAERPSMGQ